MQRNPAKRLGSGKGDAEEIKAHPFFNTINWNDVFEMFKSFLNKYFILIILFKEIEATET